MVGAYLADAMLQLIGVAAFFLPLVLGTAGALLDAVAAGWVSAGEDDWAWRCG